MKRDECDGALHEIPMREAPQRSKCYILISTVTLCYFLYPPRRTHHRESMNTAEYRDTDDPVVGMWEHADGMPPQQAGTGMGTEEKAEREKKCSHPLPHCMRW